MKINSTKGSTLIKFLLVLLAIAILSGLVWFSLTIPQKNRNDEAVLSRLSSIGTQANFYYSSAGNYGTGYTTLTTTANPNGVDITPSTVKAMCDTPYNTNGGIFTLPETSSGLNGLIKELCLSGFTNITASVDNAIARKWAVKVSGGNTFYCVDSLGSLKSYSVAPTISGATCN